MSFAIGLSGLQNAVSRLDAAAVTIARASATPPVKTTGQMPDDAAPAARAAQTSASSEAPSADLVTAVVEQISASSAFMANLKTIQSTDQNLAELTKLR